MAEATEPVPVGGVLPRWEVAELVAALDAGIAPRLLATHPTSGRCRPCRAEAPCPARRLGEAAARVKSAEVTAAQVTAAQAGQPQVRGRG